MATKKTQLKKSAMDLDVQTIFKNCIDFFVKFQIDAKHYKNFLVEEAELDETGQFWFITLGYDRPKLFTNPSELTRLLTHLEMYEREFKVFKVNALTGQVLAMKIREHAY